MYYAFIYIEETMLLLYLPSGTSAQNEFTYRNENTKIAFSKETGNICCSFSASANQAATERDRIFKACGVACNQN